MPSRPPRRLQTPSPPTAIGWRRSPAGARAPRSQPVLEPASQRRTRSESGPAEVISTGMSAAGEASFQRSSMRRPPSRAAATVGSETTGLVEPATTSRSKSDRGAPRTSIARSPSSRPGPGPVGRLGWVRSIHSRPARRIKVIPATIGISFDMVLVRNRDDVQGRRDRAMISRGPGGPSFSARTSKTGQAACARSRRSRSPRKSVKPRFTRERTVSRGARVRRATSRNESPSRKRRTIASRTGLGSRRSAANNKPMACSRSLSSFAGGSVPGGRSRATRASIRARRVRRAPSRRAARRATAPNHARGSRRSLGA